jgi:hypothetical protein
VSLVRTQKCFQRPLGIANFHSAYLNQTMTRVNDLSHSD